MGKTLKRSIINLFGVPSFGFQFWVSLEIFFFSVFLTDYALLPVALASTVMLVTGIFDVIWVPTGGIVLEKTDLRWGKYRSWMLIGPPVAVAFFLFQFAKIGSPLVNAILIIIGFLASHFIWNIYYTGHLALNSSMTQIREERVAMATNRGMFNALGAIVFSFTISQYLGTAENASQFTMVALLGGVFMVVCYYILFFLTKDHEFQGTDQAAQAAANKEKMPVIDMIRQIFVNPPLLGLLIGDAGRYLGRFVIFGMAVYFIRDVMTTPAIIGTFFTGMTITLFAGALIARPIATKIGERNTYILSLLIFIVGLLVIYAVPMNHIGFLTVMFITYLGYGMPDAVAIAMYSNTIDYGEWKTGKNARGFIMSLFAFPLKIGVLGSRTVIAAVLTIGGYVAGTAATPELIGALKIGFTLVPAAFLIVSLICILYLYRITPENLKSMQDEIAARKKIDAA